MPTRNAEATWRGDLKSGSGDLALGSGVYEGPYSFASRFEDGDATNPEELIGAAHAGCFVMALSNELDEAGYEPEQLHADAEVHLDPEALEIDWIELTLEATIPDIDEDTFQEIAAGAKAGCPVSKALAGVDIRLDATLA
ncbi:OsmC family protein [Halapricum desulfuricans]|uniref:Putative redox protein, regulator of disulfide bond formation n=1 Tax=Halapricum desulfuricans TaxID=2841257 RepID=A0A897N873_9EURY|nr:OsmC family protein [Halapricum desulfuricans]QSG08468.1 putative redox protein, regulator of disulfide bond formation [Halapricum desulfuricans]